MSSKWVSNRKKLRLYYSDCSRALALEIILGDVYGHF